MKKIISLTLLIALVFTVCACGNTNSDVRGEYIDNTQTEAFTDAPSDDVSTEAAEEKEAEFDFGNTTADTYENAFIGLGYKLDDKWSFYSDEQMNELNNLAIDVSTEEVKELIKNATLIYDMFATDEQGLNNVNINLEKVNQIQLISLDIANNFKVLAPIINDNFENMGYSNINYEISEAEIDGKTVATLNYALEINGVAAYQTIFCVKCNGYLANIAVSTFFDNNTADLLDNFYWLDK